MVGHPLGRRGYGMVWSGTLWVTRRHPSGCLARTHRAPLGGFGRSAARPRAQRRRRHAERPKPSTKRSTGPFGAVRPRSGLASTETIRGPAHVPQRAPSSLSPLSRALARGGAGQPSGGGDVGGALARGCASVCAVVLPAYPAVPGRERSTHRWHVCWESFCNQKCFSIVSCSVRVFVPPHRKRCVQHAAIQRSAAGKALVQAKNLDLLRVIKARCRRGAPLSVLGMPHRSPGVLRMREYSSTPWSTHAAEYG